MKGRSSICQTATCDADHCHLGFVFVFVHFWLVKNKHTNMDGCVFVLFDCGDYTLLYSHFIYTVHLHMFYSKSWDTVAELQIFSAFRSPTLSQCVVIIYIAAHLHKSSSWGWKNWEIFYNNNDGFQEPFNKILFSRNIPISVIEMDVCFCFCSQNLRK